MKFNRPKIPPKDTEPVRDKDVVMEEIIDTFGTKIIRLAYMYVKDQRAAEDIAQEVFLRCFQKWEQFRGESSVKSWLYSITINCCKDYLKSWSFRNLVYYDFLPKRSSPANLVLDELLEKSKKEQLAATVLQLPVKYREVIILYYYEAYSVEGICYLLKLNENTVRTRMRRAREMLKKRLEKEGREEYGQ